MSRFSRLTAGLAVATGLALATGLVGPAHAAVPDTQATPGQAFAFPSSVEFDWNVTNAEPDTVITVLYTGCGGQVAGYHRQLAIDASFFTVSADPGKLGTDWTRTLTIEQPGADTFTETVTNTDPGLQLDCSDTQEPIVAAWSKKTGRVKSKPAPGDKVGVTATELAEFTPARTAKVSYAWYADDERVARGRKLTVAKKWRGKALTMRIVAATPMDVWRQDKTIRYGTVAKARR